MKNLDKITKAFEGEKDIVLFCSKALVMKLDKELADINTSKNTLIGKFKSKNNLSLGFTSVFRNGVNLHYKT